MTTRPATLLRVFLPFALGYFLSYLFRTVNAVIAPDLVRDVGVDSSRLGLLTSAYLLAFAAFQLPLGVLLDRYGPRRVESTLLLFAAVGGVVFARAQSFGGLMAGRVLIGLGVSACLMAAFKAFTQWFPADRLPLVNGVQMISGGIGAMAASTPVELALKVTDWRGVILLVAALTVVAALCILLVVPEKEGGRSGESLGQQLAGIRTVFTSRTFWRIAPWAVAAQGTYLSVVGLWSGLWLRDVAELGRMAVANTLMGISLAMVAGYFFFGALADRLARRGIRPMSVAACGMAVFLPVQLPLVVHWNVPTLPLWMLFGFCGTASILPYALLSQSFPGHLAGRAITGLNVLVFIGAFAAQWAIGVILGMWPETGAGGYAPAGYRAAFGVLLMFQAAAAGWFAMSGKRIPRTG